MDFTARVCQAASLTIRVEQVIWLPKEQFAKVIIPRQSKFPVAERTGWQPVLRFSPLEFAADSQRQ